MSRTNEPQDIDPDNPIVPLPESADDEPPAAGPNSANESEATEPDPAAEEIPVPAQQPAERSDVLAVVPVLPRVIVRLLGGPRRRARTAVLLGLLVAASFLGATLLATSRGTVSAANVDAAAPTAPTTPARGSSSASTTPSPTAATTPPATTSETSAVPPCLAPFPPGG